MRKPTGAARAVGPASTCTPACSLAGSDAAWSAVFSQTRAIRVDSLDELVDAMVTFRFMPKPPKGKRIATLGVGGGVSVLATDECHTVGFVMPPLDEAVKRDLTRNVTSDAGIMLGNPIDFPFGFLSLNIESSRIVGSAIGLTSAAVLAGLIPSWAVMRESIIKTLWGV